MKIDPAKYRDTYFHEAAEHLDSLEAALLRLESGPHDPAAVAEAFRAAHSIKGGSDAVGFPEVARFTHGLESVLDRFRGSGPVPRQDLDLLLEAADTLSMLLNAARTGAEPPDVAEMVAKLALALTRPADAEPAAYAVTVCPHPDALRSGLDPLRLIAELAGLGTVSRVDLNTTELPTLESLDPERCYLSWVVHLQTAAPPAAVADVFAFAGDMIRVGVQPESPPVAAAAPAAQESRAAAPPDNPTTPSAAPPSLERAGLIGDFCTEAADHLDAADRHLLALDGDPTNADALNAIYRGFHTIKGVSSMLGLETVRALAHEAENLLNLARDGKLELRGSALDVAFASVDTLKRQMAFAREWATVGTPIPPDPTIPGLLTTLQQVCRGETAKAGPAAPPAPPPTPSAKPASPAPTAVPPAASSKTAPAAAPAPPPAAAPAAVAPPAPAGTPKGQPTPAPGAPAPARRPAAHTEKETVRVDKDRLDKLINTIGELVIAQAMAQEEFDEITRRTGRQSRAIPELTKISRDLQELGLSLRMVPLQGTFQKMTRLVRDLSRKMDKPVDLELFGEETELDKTVVDQLGDPLMHMVRNAVDHGLESPADRLAAGKPAEGKVTLKAYYQGGNVFIELGDDGKGLDRDRILRKAVEKGIISEGQRMTDSEIYALIFAPGFSTAAAVTDVSGRGVGMDVVRRNVESLQGSILIRTVQGKGTTFTIRLPLTLAIMDGLMVGVGGDVYVLPILAVVESFRPRRADLHTIAGRGEVVTVRGETVPLLRLYHLLGRTGFVQDPCEGLVVLVEDQGRKTALLVDELLGQMQAVVKSLDTNFRRVEGLAGATILGDGRVAMILDVHGLTQLPGGSRGPVARGIPASAY